MALKRDFLNLFKFNTAVVANNVNIKSHPLGIWGEKITFLLDTFYL